MSGKFYNNCPSAWQEKREQPPKIHFTLLKSCLLGLGGIAKFKSKCSHCWRHYKIIYY